MRTLRLLLILFLSATSLSLTNPATITGKVVAIADGDTFTLLQNNRQIRIRIDAIDAPEKGMPYAKSSKKYLAALCFGKSVTVKPVKTDRYGRTVARITLPDGKDVSTEMIRAGYAWHYKKYSKDKLLSDLEVQARMKKSGLWRDVNPMAPWEVRQMHRKGISTKALFEGSTK